ncbi:MAG: hypothetical protein OEU26_01505 [Candidatus Tectomicrobia bacterium]|nr:hypothetical protein [Candidatus Tectomicrobia bacterium]
MADLQQAHLLVQLFSENWLTPDDEAFPSGLEAWQHQQAQEAGIEVIQWRDGAIERPTEEEREAFDDDERRHFDLIFQPEVLSVEPPELHRDVVERARAACDLGRKTQVVEDVRTLLIKVTEDDFRAHEEILMEISSQAMCDFAHNGRSVVERVRREKYDAVMVVLSDGCTEDWCEDRGWELKQARQTFRDTGPLYAWFDAGSWRGAPPTMFPGILMIRGKQELSTLCDAIAKGRAT